MTDEPAVYLHVKIQLVRGQIHPVRQGDGGDGAVLEENGWHLVVALSPAIGRLGAVYHVWRVPSPDGVLSALDVVRGHPDARRWHDAFAESVQDEALELVRPTTYSRVP